MFTHNTQTRTKDFFFFGRKPIVVTIFLFRFLARFQGSQNQMTFFQLYVTETDAVVPFNNGLLKRRKRQVEPQYLYRALCENPQKPVA